MKNYDINISKKNIISSNNTCPFSAKHTDYSKTLDDLILADIMDKNTYLYDTHTSSNDIYLDKIIDYNTKKDNFITAINFINGYKKKNFPYIIGETYTLSDGTPIIFFEDSIQIGFDLYYFDDIKSPIFLKNITPSLKKKIATIYTDSLKISIYK
jgi:hypothetical protein